MTTSGAASMASADEGEINITLCISYGILIQAVCEKKKNGFSSPTRTFLAHNDRKKTWREHTNNAQVLVALRETTNMAEQPPVSAASKHKAADVSAGKRFQLFGGKCSDDARKNMLLDDVAIYSVTDARTADRITKTALALPGGPHREVCDGCACVGGNVISFARALRKGGRVTGIEFDATRCEFLKHNVAAAGVPAEILRGDVARATADEDSDDGDGWACRSAVRRADLLFLDPPWGGPDVARRPAGSVRLGLGGVDVGELCRRVAGAGFRARHVLLKLPPNYDVAFLEETLAGVAAVKVDPAFRKMILAVVSFRRGDSGEGGDGEKTEGVKE